MSADQLPRFNPNLPWYKNGEYYRAKASLYLSKCIAIRDDESYSEELRHLSAFNQARLVFESNLIEQAGLSSEGATRRLIEEHFPAIPGTPGEFTSFLESGKLEEIVSEMGLKSTLERIQFAGASPHVVIPSMSFAGKPRAYREVLQHYQAISTSTRMAVDWLVHTALETFVSTIRLAGLQDKFKDDIANIYKNLGVQRMRHRQLLTHTALKQLHRVLAAGLLPEDAGVKAGEYRIDNRAVGWDISFPVAGHVRSCMDKFITQADECLSKFIRGADDARVFDVAAEVSYRFVRIHPFPDFNGRLSRILMNMVLQLGGCTLPVALRGDSKGRKRYFTALRHANGQNLKTLGTLIALRVVETHEEVDRNLKLAGLDPIWDYAPSKDS